MAVRWVCPNCGAGKNAPSRLRKIDTRRYCLTCSEVTGVLVERTAPSLERKRQQRAADRSAVATRARERELGKDAAYRTVRLLDANGVEHEVDLVAEIERARGDFKDPSRRPVRLTVTRSLGDRVKRGTRVGHDGRPAEPGTWASGRAWDGSRHLSLTVPDVAAGGLSGGYEATLEVVYHEVAHLVAVGEGHGPKFRKMLREGLERRWPFVSYGSVHDGKVYAADGNVIHQLREHVRGGGEL